MTLHSRESRPHPGEGRKRLSVSDGNLDTLSVPSAADLLGDPDALAEHLRGYFVVQVVVNDAGHRRTYIYRTVAAAERAVQRARERGRHASTTLCQLHPVGKVEVTQ